jgi:2-oxoglutarate ferredoxin oxidoreductase subunit delta
LPWFSERPDFSRAAFLFPLALLQSGASCVLRLTPIRDLRHTGLLHCHRIIEGEKGSARRFPNRGGHVAKGRVSIIVERCKACGFCVEFCPTKVLALSSAFNSKGYHPPHVVHPDKCSGCDLCGMYCPDFAIFGAKAATAKEKP